MTAVAAVVAAGIVVAGTNDGEPVRDVRLLSGAAWLTSSKVGQVTLLDGSAAEVAAQVHVAAAGNDLEVAQQGSTAYAIDRSTGSIRRVDGATFVASSPGQPIPDTRAGLTVMPGTDTLYTLDTRRGVLASTDPRELTRRGELVTLANELKPGTAAVDEAGTLWATDAKTGDLTYVADGKRNIRRQVTKPGQSLLTIANGSPVVIDLTERTAIEVDGTNGRPGGSIELDLRSDDTVQATGSRHAERLYLVVSRGVLVVCDLSANTCDTTIPLKEGSRFGAPVETEDHVFVPDFSTGEVWVIDVTGPRVIAKASVLPPNGPFELLSRDGVVFYNDPDSERAGVIRLDGTVIKAAKYDPANPARGLSGLTQPTSGSPPTSRTVQSQQSNTPSQVTPTSQANQVGGASPSTRVPDPTGSQPQSPGQQSGSPPDPSTPTTSASSTSSTSPTTSSTTSTTRPPDPVEPRLEISMSDTTPTANQAITLQVSNTAGDQPTGAQWTFGDGKQGSGTTTTHIWATARPTPYLITVIATMPNGQQATTSTNVTVSQIPTVRLSVSIAGGGGTVSGGGINCPGTCSIDVQPDTQITLTADPDSSHVLGNWGGDCAGAGGARACDITVDVAKSVTYRFDVPAPQRFTLTMTPPSNGTIRHPGGTCPGLCSAQFDQGTQVQLTADPNQGYEFSRWSGACGGMGTTCTVTMSSNQSVSAAFQIPAPVITSLRCNPVALNSFECNLTATPPTGIQIRWVVDGVPDGNGTPHLNSRCGPDRSAIIVATVTNAGGSDTEQSAALCESG